VKVFPAVKFLKSYFKMEEGRGKPGNPPNGFCMPPCLSVEKPIYCPSLLQFIVTVSPLFVVAFQSWIRVKVGEEIQQKMAKFFFFLS